MLIKMDLSPGRVTILFEVCDALPGKGISIEFERRSFVVVSKRKHGKRNDDRTRMK